VERSANETVGQGSELGAPLRFRLESTDVDGKLASEGRSIDSLALRVHSPQRATVVKTAHWPATAAGRAWAAEGENPGRCGGLGVRAAS
jgi:hypothetical protein